MSTERSPETVDIVEALDELECIVGALPPEAAYSFHRAIELIARLRAQGEREPVGYQPGTTMGDGTVLWMDDTIMRHGDTPEDFACDTKRPLYAHPQASEPSGWRPIETAPKDEPIILYAEGVWDIGRLDAVSTFPFATHWMPLPASPHETGGGAL